MLLIHLLNNFQQECLLRQMDRLLEKNIDLDFSSIMLLTHLLNNFYFSSMMFAKKNEMTVA